MNGTTKPITSKHSKEDDVAEEEASDSFTLNLDKIKSEDEARIQSLRLGGGNGKLPMPSPMGTAPSTSANAKKQAPRRTSLMQLMLGGKSKSELLGGSENDSPSSPSRRKQKTLRSESNLSQGSLHSSGSRNPVTQVLSQTMTAMDRRRSSIMTRMLGYSGAPRNSVDVTQALIEQAKARPVSEPAFRVTTKLDGDTSPGKSRIKTPEDKSWEERWTVDDLPYYYNKLTETVTWEKPDPLKTDEEKEHEDGQWTWVPHPQFVWQGARVVKKSGNGDIICKTLVEGKSMTVPANGRMKDQHTGGRDQLVPLWPLTKSSLYRLEDDLVALDDPNEALILHNLRARFRENNIYTWVGASRSVLVSINPYKSLPDLYNKTEIVAQAEKSPNRPPQPHVFAVAADSLETLLYDATDNSILISGESGSGKTEATKHALKFLATIAGSKSNVEKRVIEANPILEAFGNAKTIRNNNSSRFGKWIEVNFDSKTRQISGATITTYLLERSRVVFQQKNERSYHIFYQLCTNDAFRAQYGIGSCESFRYLSNSGCVSIDGVDDAAELANVMRCMTEMGFEPEEQEWIFKTVCVVLHLGNIDFVEVQDPKAPVVGTPMTTNQAASSSKGLVGSRVSNKPRKAATNKRGLKKGEGSMIDTTASASRGVKKSESGVMDGGGGGSGPTMRRSSLATLGDDFGYMHLREAAALFGCTSHEEMERVLCYRSVTVREEKSVIPLSCEEARSGADSFSTQLYSRLFEWLVGRVNQSLGGGGKGHFIGVLDIFGFEIFETNSFEQLCINFANEKLQGQFNQSMFKEEEGLYAFEEIEYKKVEFQDNWPVLLLIEGKPDGLMLQLDDEVRAPGGSDVRYASKMTKSHAGSKAFQVDAKKKMESNLSFQIVHYAGVVKYDAKGFVQANTETLSEDVHMLGNASKDLLTASLFPLDDDFKPARYVPPLVIQAGVGGGRGVAKSVATAATGKKSMAPGVDDRQRKKTRAQSNASVATGLTGAQAERVNRATMSKTRGKADTVSTQFREQLNELMTMLENTESRYIRCVKPNTKQQPESIDSGLVLEQLRYSGVFEAVAIRRQGYPFRLTHQQFCCQYKCINTRLKHVTYRNPDSDPTALAQEILDISPQKDFRNIKIGKTRVLYRAREHKLLLLLRNLALEKLIPFLQARLRGYIARNMRKIFKQCDDALQDAIDRENDADAIEDALKEVEQLIGARLHKMFPRAEPVKKKRAETLLVDIKAWLAHEEVLEKLNDDDRPANEIYFEIKAALKKADGMMHVTLTRSQERLVENLRAKLAKMETEQKDERFAMLDAKAREALESLDRAKMAAVLVEAEEGGDESSDGRKSDAIANIKRVLKEMDDKEAAIDAAIATACKNVDRLALEAVVKENDDYGKKYKQVKRNTSECVRLLGLSEQAFCKLELEVAVKQGDERRRIHREIRLQEFHLDESGQRYRPMTECRIFRSPDQWARAKFTTRFWGKDKLIAGMLVYNAKPVHYPLTSFGGNGDADTPERRKKALLCSKMMVAFAGGNVKVEVSSPDECAKFILKAGLDDALLRDEIYMLIFKQLNNCPDAPQRGEVYSAYIELLGLCLSTFPPSKELELWVLQWIREHLKSDAGGKMKKYTSAVHAVKYGKVMSNPKSVPELRKELEARTQSRFSLQPGQNSGPSPPDQLALG